MRSGSISPSLIVKNAFWALPRSDPHDILSFDKLHVFDVGLWAKHFWPLLQEVLTGAVGSENLTVIDDRSVSILIHVLHN